MGRTALTRVPEDLRHFCETLDIPMMEVLEWYAEFRPKAAKSPTPRSELMKTQEVHFRRQRSPSETRPEHSTSTTGRGSSPMRAPQTRRAIIHSSAQVL